MVIHGYVELAGQAREVMVLAGHSRASVDLAVEYTTSDSRWASKVHELTRISAEGVVIFHGDTGHATRVAEMMRPIAGR